MQDGDVEETSSNTNLLYALTNYRAKKTIEQGISEFVNWYKKYYNSQYPFIHKKFQRYILVCELFTIFNRKTQSNITLYPIFSFSI